MRSLKRPKKSLALGDKQRYNTRGKNAGAIRDWSSSATDVVNFKHRYSVWAFYNQLGRCAYCDVLLGVSVRRDWALDHFVPQATCAEWRFEMLNLLVSCSTCNGGLKRSMNPVEASVNLPSKCKRISYRICHPYFDDVSRHIAGGFFGSGQHGLVPVRGKSDKGRATIELFKLHDPNLISVWLERPPAVGPAVGVVRQDLERLVFTALQQMGIGAL